MDEPTRCFSVWQGMGSGAVVILSAPSGIHYSNQVGGMSCLHPTYEGAAIPVEDVGLPHDEPSCGCWGEPISDSYAETCDRLFKAHNLPIRVDRARIAESTECWIPIVVVAESLRGTNWHDEWARCVGMVGIYTTMDNCD